ncbi:MAG: glycosyltransferase, partial [Spirochaetota bacterium]
LKMVLVCGPRVSASSLNVPRGVEVREYVPALYRHFAACDLAVVQGGGASVLELAALKRPFLYFPLQGHSEQMLHISKMLEGSGVGRKMIYHNTTPRSLARAIVSSLGKKVDYPPLPLNGAATAAGLISNCFR